MVNVDYLDPEGKSLMPAGATTKDAERIALEAGRKGSVRLRRMFYDGRQYDGRNEDRAKASQVDVWELPEHERLHAYSTHVQDCIDYIASQIADGFSFAADDPEVNTIILTALQASPDLRGSAGMDDVSLTNMVRDALVAQDTPVRLRWDPVKDTVWLEFWLSEEVEFVYDQNDRHLLTEVHVEQMVWTTGVDGNPLKRLEHRRWSLEAGECVVETWFDQDDPHAKEMLGVPFLPWHTLRARRKNPRNARGESVITEQAMQHTNRFNALEQTAYLIARYNSHGNLAVIGDGATLKAQMDERISKDVADILTFPGGTALQVLQLPTDPQMIEHQKHLLSDALFESFGLTRVDIETISGLGQVSGYALEILNRKTDGTFNQVRNQYIGDFRELCNKILDMHAYKAAEAQDLQQTDLFAPVDIAALNVQAVDRMLSIDPMTVFPVNRRKFTLNVGSGYVIDRTSLIAEYTAKLISRQEYLRRTGYDQSAIEKIMGEIKDETPPAPVVNGLAAQTIGAAVAGAASKAAPAAVKK